MVRDDHAEDPSPQPGPEQLAVGGLADRRRALARGLAVADLLGGQGQVVRARLGGKPNALALRGGDHGERIGTGQMHDVRVPAGRPGRLDDLGDGQVLHAAGVRGQVAGVAAARISPSSRRGPRALRVDEQRPPERCQRAQRGGQLTGVHRREVGRAGVGQEAFEPGDTGPRERFELGRVARDHPAPEPHVDMALTVGRPALGRQRGRADRGRDAVQRHVDQRGDPACRGGPGGAGEALPLGVTRFADVHMRVDEAGQEHHVLPEFQGVPAAQPAVR